MNGSVSPPKKTLLTILDGFGLAPIDRIGNAITPKTAPNFFSYLKKYPNSQINTTGAAVGLFVGQKGNSEAGHLNIGSGRVVKQDLVRISEAIHNGTFFKNEAFRQALFHAKKYHTAVHIFSLLTDHHSAHAYPEHLYALLEFLRREKQHKVFIHLFTDGRDSLPKSASGFLHELRSHMLADEKIATVMGRFYAMDRNKLWDRTKEAYEAMVLGRGRYNVASAEEAIMNAYDRNETDEYISPTVVVENGQPVGRISHNDAVFFVNSRSDRARQLTKAFVQPDFQKKNPGAFRRTRRPKNIRFVAMTDFGPDLPRIFTAFPSPDVETPLAKAIGEHYRQLYISETEKYAHVTYFLNGGHAAPVNGEERELVASGDVYSYVDKPEMHAAEVVDRILNYLKNDKFDFFCVNLPNADMVGHTGDFDAAERAVSALDKQLARLVEAFLSADGQVLVVADHGNAEEMIDEKTGGPLTEHTDNPVPFLLISRQSDRFYLSDGVLSDVAPTLLNLLGLPIPSDMTGKILLKEKI